MYLLALTIILVFLIPDITVRFSLGGIVLKTQFTNLVFYYLIFRYRLGFVAVILFIYSIVVWPFTGLGFTHIFFSQFMVLAAFYVLRTNIFLESYFVQPFWVFWMLFFHGILIHVLDFASFKWVTLPETILAVALNGVLNSLFVIPLFLLWDFFFKRIRRRSYPSTELHGGTGRGRLL